MSTAPTMHTHVNYVISETGQETDQFLASVHPAHQDMVNMVLSQPVDEDGRSEFCWIRLQNGALILGLFPQGDTYEYLTQGGCDTEYPGDDLPSFYPEG